MKEGLLTKLGRKAAPYLAPYLLAGSISLPFVSCTGNPRSIMPSEPIVQEEYSPQEQNKAEQAQIWYEEASQDNIISPEELNDLEARIEYKQNDSGKHKAVSLAQLASEITPNCDLNKDGKTNIFDLIELLKILQNEDNYPALAGDVNNNGKTNIFDLITLLQVLGGNWDTYLIRGQHFDNDTETGKNAVITIDGKEYATDIQGNFNVRKEKKDSYLITARQLDENGFVGYKRTITIPGMDIDTLKMFSVSYPTQEGVSPELFKAFCDEAMAVHGGSNGFGEYYGLKTGLKNPKNRFWISSHGDSATYSVGGKATAEEQAYVKNLLETVIYPHLRQEYRFPIYVEDPNNPETMPAFQDGSIVVVPRNGWGFGIGSVDYNHDGIADWSIIYFPNGGWNQTEKGPIIEELLSALAGMGEVSHYLNLTALESNKTGEITQIDDKLINIQHRYRPKEDIENILGM